MSRAERLKSRWPVSTVRFPTPGCRSRRPPSRHAAVQPSNQLTRRIMLTTALAVLPVATAPSLAGAASDVELIELGKLFVEARRGVTEASRVCHQILEQLDAACPRPDALR